MHSHLSAVSKIHRELLSITLRSCPQLSPREKRFHATLQKKFLVPAVSRAQQEQQHQQPPPKHQRLVMESMYECTEPHKVVQFTRAKVLGDTLPLTLPIATKINCLRMKVRHLKDIMRRLRCFCKSHSLRLSCVSVVLLRGYPDMPVAALSTSRSHYGCCVTTIMSPDFSDNDLKDVWLGQRAFGELNITVSTPVWFKRFGSLCGGLNRT